MMNDVSLVCTRKELHHLAVSVSHLRTKLSTLRFWYIVPHKTIHKSIHTKISWGFFSFTENFNRKFYIEHILVPARSFSRSFSSISQTNRGDLVSIPWRFRCISAESVTWHISKLCVKVWGPNMSSSAELSNRSSSSAMPRCWLTVLMIATRLQVHSSDFTSAEWTLGEYSLW